VVSKRGESIGALLGQFYVAKGCDNTRAAAAQKHFEQNSKVKPDVTTAFISDIENR
jgi:hypothetical protein